MSEESKVGCWDDGVEILEVKGPVHRVRFIEDDHPASMWFCNFCSGSFFQKYKTGYVCACTNLGEGELVILPVATTKTT